MIAAPDVLRAAATRILPAFALFALAVRLLDQPPTSPDALARLAAQGWVAILVRPLVIALGFAAALHAVRARVDAAAVRSTARAACAVGVILATQLVASLLVRAAGPSVGVPLDLLAGAAAALLVYAAPPRLATRPPHRQDAWPG